MDFLKNLKESKAVKAIQGFYSKHVIRKLFLTILRSEERRVGKECRL